MPLRNVVLGRNIVNFASLEDILRGITARKRQAIVRFYLDFPGTVSGIPDYLTRGGLAVQGYSNHGNCNACSRIPNYADARLQECILNFVTQLGRRYDGDPRIFTFQVGLIGFWGEWHTWPLKYTSFNFPSVGFQKQLLQMFHNVFSRTHIQVGINAATLPLFQSRQHAAAVQSWRIGFSDDSLLSTSYDTFLGQNLRLSNTSWKHQISPVGGEIYPPLQQCAFSANSCVGSNTAISNLLRTSRASWALNAYLFGGGLPALSVSQRANSVAKSMGYRFVAVRAFVIFTPNYTTVNITMRNTGTAPFYGKLRLGVRHALFDLVLSESLQDLKPDGILYYVRSAPPLPNVNIRYDFVLYMYSPNVLDTQNVAFSNANINAKGELPFTADPQRNIAYPWIRIP